jgi:hypothetical protein
VPHIVWSATIGPGMTATTTYNQLNLSARGPSVEAPIIAKINKNILTIIKFAGEDKKKIKKR